MNRSRLDMNTASDRTPTTAATRGEAGAVPGRAGGGGRGALLAVREVFLGNRRFDEMIKRTGAPRDTLAARLRTLIGAGILERRRYAEHPARFEYLRRPAAR